MPPKAQRRPRVGVSWRSTAEEKAGQRRRYDLYLNAVRAAGGQPVEVSLLLPNKELRALAESLDAVVLPGNAADVDPRRYGAKRLATTAEPDRPRERTDVLLLDAALAGGKPVLAICYGAQLLNVHLHGSLVQDIPSEVPSPINHERDGHGGSSLHPVRVMGGRLRELSGPAAVRVNSTHHQSILQPGRGLRIAASAPDGVVEAVESSGPEWIVGVQWHPERMRRADNRSENGPSGPRDDEDNGNGLADALFRRLVAEARRGSRRTAGQPSPVRRPPYKRQRKRPGKRGRKTTRMGTTK